MQTHAVFNVPFNTQQRWWVFPVSQLHSQ